MASSSSMKTGVAPRSHPLPHHPFLPALSHLHTAALSVLPHSPVISAHLSASLDALAGSKELLLNAGISRAYCSACRTVSIPGWTMTVRSGSEKEASGVSKREARRRKMAEKTKLSGEGLHSSGKPDAGVVDASSNTRSRSSKSPGSRLPRQMIYTCLVCSTTSQMPLSDPPLRRRLENKPTQTEDTSAALPTPAARNPPAPSTTGPGTSTSTKEAAQSTAKSRAKKRKQGGLMGELEAMKKRKKEEEERKRLGGGGGGLGGLDLMDLMKLDG